MLCLPMRCGSDCLVRIDRPHSAYPMTLLVKLIFQRSSAGAYWKGLEALTRSEELAKRVGGKEELRWETRGCSRRLWHVQSP